MSQAFDGEILMILPTSIEIGLHTFLKALLQIFFRIVVYLIVPLVQNCQLKTTSMYSIGQKTCAAAKMNSDTSYFSIFFTLSTIFIKFGQNAPRVLWGGWGLEAFS
jgi:hypothetical protein